VIFVNPWNSEKIDQARRVRFDTVLNFLGAYHKRDAEYEPLDPRRKSVRVQINYEGRDFRMVITGEKFVNELLSADHRNRGGGGTIDFVRHLTGLNFVQSVKVCLDAYAETETLK
jgi:hypothetical protein